VTFLNHDGSQLFEHDEEDGPNRVVRVEDGLVARSVQTIKNDLKTNELIFGIYSTMGGLQSRILEGSS
jgi:hypothetical protein